VSSADKQRLKLEQAKHFHQLLQYEESKVGQVLTWLFASQGLLGAGYAYLKHQVAAAIAQNRIVSPQSSTTLLEWFPLVASLVCTALLFSLCSLSARYAELLRIAPLEPYSHTSPVGKVWPLAAIAVATLCSLGWLAVMVALP
jgi:hypothetical protein